MPRRPTNPSASTPATVLLARAGETFAAHLYDSTPDADSYGRRLSHSSRQLSE
jgi:hypothetical protein